MKGKEVRFIGGKYSGKRGWINMDKENGENTVPVIVDLGKKGEKETYVYDYSLELEDTGIPATYAQAVIQQCPDLDCALTKVCRGFAKCNIRQDPEGFIGVVQKKMTEATKLQEDKGSKALYRRIQFNGGTI